MSRFPSRFVASALCSVLLLSPLALAGCASPSGGGRANKRPKRPSIARVRFFNETKDKTVEAMNTRHIVVWHGTDTSEPVETDASKVGVHGTAVPSHDSVELHLLQHDVSTHSVKCRFRIEGHPTTTHWIPIPDPATGNYITEVQLTIVDSGNDLGIVAIVSYLKESTGRIVSKTLDIVFYP